MKLAIIGAGWAGCAAAVQAAREGHAVSLFEAARQAGGRARRLPATLQGQNIALDNGQHILIGAYNQTLQLMREMGCVPEQHLLRLPLSLQFADGLGLRLPAWPGWVPPAISTLAGILQAPGWSGADRRSLLTAALRWRLSGFECVTAMSVVDLCRGITPHVMQTLIEPLCISALNTPAERASGQVFLRVLKDALFSQSAGSDLLLPRTDLSALLPDAALAWLKQQGQSVQLGTRVQHMGRTAQGWTVQATCAGMPLSGHFDAVLLACPALEAARLTEGCGLPASQWISRARGLRYEAITTVYLHAPGQRLSQPMLALRTGPIEPAQFVFDRGQLHGPTGLLALVVSASTATGGELREQVMAQAARQLSLPEHQLEHLQTVVEKRATFACTPGLLRPGTRVLTSDDTLMACGDYVAGPYPATLEGAVRSGLEAARQVSTSTSLLR
jgi:squalene-associated FAD-dependent desaturase